MALMMYSLNFFLRPKVTQMFATYLDFSEAFKTPTRITNMSVCTLRILDGLAPCCRTRTTWVRSTVLYLFHDYRLEVMSTALLEIMYTDRFAGQLNSGVTFGVRECK